jgi:hypothetical protein
MGWAEGGGGDGSEPCSGDKRSERRLVSIAHLKLAARPDKRFHYRDAPTRPRLSLLPASAARIPPALSPALKLSL